MSNFRFILRFGRLYISTSRLRIPIVQGFGGRYAILEWQGSRIWGEKQYHNDKEK
jgi:hypothetical protein